MSTPESLRIQRKSYTVAYSEFIRGYARNSNRIFMFFEGEDLKYYGLRIEKYTTNYIPFSCAGKNNVKTIRDLILKNYTSAASLFFIDRDFDDESDNPENTFVTECYSIENYYLSQRTIESFLKQEMLLSEIHEEYVTAIRIFNRLKTEFINSILELNKIILLVKKTGFKSVRLNLSSFNVMKYVSINLDSITSGLSRESIFSAFKIDGSLIDTKELESIDKQLHDQAPECWIRGKFLFDFLIKYLSLIIEDANSSGGKVFNSKVVCKFRVDKATALSDLSRFAYTPEKLDRFLVEKCKC